jgi:hypothetical protein|tara:strand:+ start:2091 stop:2585 length:495 start_codon:yes stop_codon:yes gene_type:complete
MEKIFYIDNLKKEVKDIRSQLIDDCIISTKNKIHNHYNYEVFTKHHKALYSLFIKSCKKYFKNLKIHNTPTRLWSYCTDKDYTEGEVWHNHIKSCTLCGVLYLKTVKNCGIDLRHNNKITYVEPKNYDLLIFPGFLDHKPRISKTKKRISLQFEIFCDKDVTHL